MNNSVKIIIGTYAMCTVFGGVFAESAVKKSDNPIEILDNIKKKMDEAKNLPSDQLDKLGKDTIGSLSQNIVKDGSPLSEILSIEQKFYSDVVNDEIGKVIAAAEETKVAAKAAEEKAAAVAKATAEAKAAAEKKAAEEKAAAAKAAAEKKAAEEKAAAEKATTEAKAAVQSMVNYTRSLYNKPDKGEGYKTWWNWYPLTSKLNEIYAKLDDPKFPLTPEQRLELVLQIPGSLNGDDNWEKNKLKEYYTKTLSSSSPITKPDIMNKACDILIKVKKLSTSDKNALATKLRR